TFPRRGMQHCPIMASEPTSSEERVFGLDLMRAIAIALVLVCHSWALSDVPSYWGEGIASVLGVLGVELFFVLSGFLIGNILLRQFEHGVDVGEMFSFWRRRWFRTLPAYYLYLLINIGLAGLFHLQRGALWPYIV